MESQENHQVLELISTDCQDTFQCGPCQNVFHDLDTFLEHKKVCQLQDAAPAEEEFIQVIESVIDTNPTIIDHLTCSICLKRFKKTHNLKQHLLIHSNEKPHQCSICGKNFAQKSNLKKHLLIHLEQNNKKDESKVDISFEIITKTGRKHAIEPVETYKCQHCEFESSSKIDLKRHGLSLHFDCKTILKCEQCLHVFSNQKLLDLHVQRCHQDHEKSGFQCSICQKSFATQEYLKKHFLTHNQEAEYQCDTCEKMFKRSDNLRRHMKIHSADPGIKCPFSHLTGCKRNFKRHDKLKEHIKTHGNVKQTQCSFCQEVFFDSEELSLHISSMHNNVMLNDEVNEDDDALVGESQLVAQEDQNEVMVDNETPVFYVQLPSPILLVIP